MANGGSPPRTGALSERERAAVLNNETLPLGKHTLAFQGELVRLTIGGDMPMAEVLHLHLFFEEMLRLGRRVFLLTLTDIRPRPLPAEVRRWLADWNKRHHASALALVSELTWAIKVIVALVSRAISLVRGIELPVAIFTNEAEARAWLDELMRQLPKG